MMETLFTIASLELFLGGGGRLLEVGSVTVRMILFAVCVVASVAAALRRTRRGDGVPLALGLVAAYLVIHVGALMIGTLHGHEVESGRLELQQSLYWLAAPFMATVLHSRAMVLRAAFLVRVAGAILAVCYIGAVLGLALGAVDYSKFYALLDATGEFFFRGENFFFYKGFLYLCISTIFFLALPGRYSHLGLAILALAVVLTTTRGFVLSTSLAALMLLVATRRWRLLLIVAAAVSLVMFFLWVYLPSQDDSVAATRESSNATRIEDFGFVVDHFRVSTLLFGEGLGALINERLNIENTFLWALYRLGVVGLAFWLTPLLLCFAYFSRVRRTSLDFRLACAYFFSVVLVYVQTFTNPYLNNPIGLSFVLIALFSLRTLTKLPTTMPSIAAPSVRTPARAAAA